MAKTYQRTKLQEVTIRGYKSIAYDRPVTLKLGDVSILLGANGAGKSNIISFFRMLSYMMSKSFGRYVEISGTSHALLHYGIKRTPVMSGELKFADSNSMDVYGFSLANATPDRLIITEERITWHRKGEKKPYEIALEPNFKESALAECEDPVAKTIFQMLSYCKVYQFHDSSTEGPRYVRLVPSRRPITSSRTETICLLSCCSCGRTTRMPTTGLLTMSVT